MSPRPRLCSLTPVVFLAIFGACRGDSGPPTAATLSAPSSASSEEIASIGGPAGGGSPRAEDVRASVAFRRIFGRFRNCEGADGAIYQETDFTLTGTSAGDPRLTGDIEVNVRDLVNLANNVGPQTGRILIRDASGREKARADYTAWGHAGSDYVQGTAVGPVRGDNGGRLVAGWTIQYAGPAGIFGEFDGESRDGQVPAGIYSGHCSGGTWTRIDFTFGGGAAAAEAMTTRIPRR
jgi:hypothetical protein